MLSFEEKVVMEVDFVLKLCSRDVDIDVILRECDNMKVDIGCKMIYWDKV